MEKQQKFGQRLEALLDEKGISQGEFADLLHCSRQSINFYILGKRSPDIALAARMADRLGVSCDYLIGRSDIRQTDDANITAGQLGMADETIRFFGGLNLMATGRVTSNSHGDAAISSGIEKTATAIGMLHAKDTLALLNRLIAHDRFGVMLQYIRRYRDILHDEDILTPLRHFMVELESPATGNVYGSNVENKELMADFCLHIASNHLAEIIRDIAKD